MSSRRRRSTTIALDEAATLPPSGRTPADSTAWDDQWRHRLYEALDMLEGVHWDYLVYDDSLQVAWARARDAVIAEIREIVEGAERAWRHLCPTYGLPYVARQARQTFDRVTGRTGDTEED